MATSTFDDLALQYVVLDDEVVMRDLAVKAAKAIEDAGASRNAVGNWAASIKLWIAPGLVDNRGADPGKEEEESGNAITRAKAIGFLAATLEVLNKDLLRADQINLLIAFFGSMFSNDHKAGIAPAAKALNQLVDAKNFEPAAGVKIIEDVSKMKEDFRLQTAATRLEVYHLLLRLIQDVPVATQLQSKYNGSGGFVLDLLSMCQHERDPKNLLVWFEIMATVAAAYTPTDEITNEIFKAFSNYFPITLRESTTPIGVTPEELKSALRRCFSAHHRLARLTFPYLLQRLDKGDSMKVTVKNDILMTIEACIERYRDTTIGLIPFIPSIWNSLKYEVRNGEVAETVQSATSVLRAIAVRFQDDKPQLNDYVNMVFGDSLDDLSEPDYVKPAGQICLAVISSSPQAFVSHSPKLVDSVVQKIPQFKSATYATYTRDLLELLYAILNARQTLVHLHPDNDKLLAAKSATHFQNLFHKVYLQLWQNNVAEEGSTRLDILRAITGGVAMLVAQEIVLPDGKRSLLCSVDVCKEICSLFTHRLLIPLTLSPRDAATMIPAVDIGIQEALSTVVTHYMDGFQMIVAATTDIICDRDWKSASRRSINHLWQVIAQVSFIGCSQVPQEIALTSANKNYSSLHHFLNWTGALLQLTESFLANGADARVVKLMVAGLHHSMCFFRDACGGEELQVVNLHADGEDSLDWEREVKRVTAGKEIPLEWQRLLRTFQSPDVLAPTQPNTVDDTQAVATPRQDLLAGPNYLPIFTDCIRLSLFIVRYLFRRFTKETHDSEGNMVLGLADEIASYPEKRRRAILEHIERMAPMTIKAMDARSQLFYKLPTEAFRLFSDCKVTAPYWRVEEEGALDLLTLSILKGLWPDAMTDLYDRDGIAQTLLCNDTYPLSANISKGQAWIVALLANKYKSSPSAFDFAEVVQFWQSRIEQNMASYDTENAEVGIDIERVLSILVGAVPRQEKALLPLIPLVHKVIGLPNSVGETLAEELGIVFDENEYLLTELHAVVKPLFKQWTYAHLVKPMYSLAVPAPSASEDAKTSAEHYTAAILSVLDHCSSFAIYESDIEPLLSMILAVLSNGENDKINHIEVALSLLREIMRNDPAALKYHLRAIIAALTQLYRVNLETGDDPHTRPRTDWPGLYFRELASVEPPRIQHHPRDEFSVSFDEDEDEDEQPFDPSSISSPPRTIPPSRLDKQLFQRYAGCRKAVLEVLGDIPHKYEERYIMPFRGSMNLFLDSCCGDPVRELRRVAVEAREGWFGLA